MALSHGERPHLGGLNGLSMSGEKRGVTQGTSSALEEKRLHRFEPKIRWTGNECTLLPAGQLNCNGSDSVGFKKDARMATLRGSSSFQKSRSKNMIFFKLLERKKHIGIYPLKYFMLKHSNVRKIV